MTHVYMFYENDLPKPLHSFIFTFPLIRLNEFLIGNLAGLFYLNYKKRKETLQKSYKKNYDFWLILLAVIFLFVLKNNKIMSLFLGFQLEYANGLLMPFYVSFILLISLNKGFLDSFFDKKIFVTLGGMSYALYILQDGVFAWTLAIHTRFKLQNYAIPRFYYSFLILLLVSFFVYYFFDKKRNERFFKSTKK